MAAKTRKASAKERLAKKQEEAAVASVEKKEKPVKAKAKAAKPKKTLTLADIQKKAEAALLRAQKLQRQAETLGNPLLAPLIEKVEQVTKEVNSFNRFIKVRTKGVITRARELRKAEKALEDLQVAKGVAEDRLVEAQRALDAARAEAKG